MISTTKIIISLIFVLYLTDKATSEKERCITEVYDQIKIERSSVLTPLQIAWHIFYNIIYDDLVSSDAHEFAEKIRRAIRLKSDDTEKMKSPNEICVEFVFNNVDGESIIFEDDNPLKRKTVWGLKTPEEREYYELKLAGCINSITHYFKIFNERRFSANKTIKYVFENLRKTTFDQLDKNGSDKYAKMYYDHVESKLSFRDNKLKTPEKFCDDRYKNKNDTNKGKSPSSSSDAYQEASKRQRNPNQKGKLINKYIK